VVNACRSASRRAKRERSVDALFVVEDTRLEADEMFDALGALPYGSAPRSCFSFMRAPTVGDREVAAVS